MRTRKDNGEGSCRKIVKDEWECTIQSSYLNPKTLKPKRFKRKGKTEQDARDNAKMAMLQWEKEFDKTKQDKKLNKGKTFGEYMVDYMENVISKRVQDSTYHSYYRDMQNYFLPYKIAKMQLHMLSVETFQEYYDEIGEKYTKKTCMTPIQWCRQLCTILVNESKLRENYALQAAPKKEVVDEFDKKRNDELKSIKKIFTLEDIDKFYQAYKNGLGQYPLIVMFLLETGLRAQEFASITNDCIDFENRTILIEKTRGVRFKDKNDVEGGVEYYIKVPKNKKQRKIYMSDLCVEVVKAMQEQTRQYCKKNDGNYLYPTFINGKPRSNSSMEVCFKDLCNRLGIDRGVHITKKGNQKGLCLHALRDTMSSLSKAYGTPTSSVALMLGHSERVNESHYTFANPEILSKVVTPSKILKQEDKDLWQEFLEFKKWKEQQGE